MLATDESHDDEHDETDLRHVFDQLAKADTDDQALRDVVISDDLSFMGVVTLAALDEYGSYKEAAEILRRKESGLRSHIKNLRTFMQSEIVVPVGDSRYKVCNEPRVLELRDRARLMLYQYGAISRLGDPTIRIRYLPQHVFFMAPVEARLERGIGTPLHPRPLGEEDRAIERFQRNVLAAVAGGMIDFAIGLPPEGIIGDSLQVKYLYSARLEAMVPKAGAPKSITLGELVSEGKMLVPPMKTRSRALLEQEIASDVPGAPPPARRVKREAFGTKVLHQYGLEGLGTCVVPSDIAYPFKAGQDHGGPRTEDFTWIPVCRSSGEYIFQSVYASYRNRPKSEIVSLCEQVQLQVDQLGLEKRPTDQPVA
jgi:DNA-binding transcriptional LysR family regulator